MTFIAHWYVQFASFFVIMNIYILKQNLGGLCPTAPLVPAPMQIRKQIHRSNWVVVLKESVVCFNFLIGGGADIAIIVGLAHNSNITLYTCMCNSGGAHHEIWEAHAPSAPPVPSL